MQPAIEWQLLCLASGVYGAQHVLVGFVTFWIDMECGGLRLLDVLPIYHVVIDIGYVGASIKFVTLTVRCRRRMGVTRVWCIYVCHV